jgi:CRISPR type III-A-associated protein Csm2
MNGNRSNNRPVDLFPAINRKLSEKPDQALHEMFRDEDLYLPGGDADNIAQSLQSLNTNQLRKVFDMIEKASVQSKEGHFDKALQQLYMVVPMVAYATGRKLIGTMNFNTFIQRVITPKRIRNDRDVQTLFTLMQSVLAYKKLYE